MRIFSRLAGAFVAILAVLVASPGWALESCSGSYSATLLHPLPARLVVGLVISDDSPRNLELAARFKDGLQRAGIAVGGAANVQMRVIASVSGRDDDLGAAPRSDSASSWWNGGADQQLPGESRFGGNRQSSGPVTLRLRVEIRRSATDPVAWAATLRCTMRGDDERQLAYDIGTVIGGAVGRRVERKSF